MHAQKVRPRGEKHDSDVFMYLKGEPEGRVGRHCLPYHYHTSTQTWLKGHAGACQNESAAAEGQQASPRVCGAFRGQAAAAQRWSVRRRQAWGCQREQNLLQTLSLLSRVPSVNRAPIWSSVLLATLTECVSGSLDKDRHGSGPLEVILGSGSDISGPATGLLLSYDLLHLSRCTGLSLSSTTSLYNSRVTQNDGEKKSVRISLKFKLPIEVSISILDPSIVFLPSEGTFQCPMTSSWTQFAVNKCQKQT